MGVADRSKALLRSAEHRRLFQRAVREGTSLAVARQRTTEERWAAADARLANARGVSAEDDQQPQQKWMLRD